MFKKLTLSKGPNFGKIYKRDFNTHKKVYLHSSLITKNEKEEFIRQERKQKDNEKQASNALIMRFNIDNFEEKIKNFRNNYNYDFLNSFFKQIKKKQHVQLEKEKRLSNELNDILSGEKIKKNKGLTERNQTVSTKFRTKSNFSVSNTFNRNSNNTYRHIKPATLESIEPYQHKRNDDTELYLSKLFSPKKTFFKESDFKPNRMYFYKTLDDKAQRIIKKADSYISLPRKLRAIPVNQTKVKKQKTNKSLQQVNLPFKDTSKFLYPSVNKFFFNQPGYHDHFEDVKKKIYNRYLLRIGPKQTEKNEQKLMNIQEYKDNILDTLYKESLTNNDNDEEEK